MAIHSFTEPGGKVVNEDCVIARRHPASAFGYLCILADGHGGQANGGLASRAACESAWRLASAVPLDVLLQKEAWEEILCRTDAAVEKTGGFTTLVALAIGWNSAAGASCGDSKAYYAGPDQQVAEWTRAQAKNPPVGSGNARFTAFSGSGLSGGRVIVLSDGAWKYCGYDALKAAFTAPLESLQSHFRGAIMSRTGVMLPDDMSVIAVDVD